MYDRLALPENIAPLKDRLDIRCDKLGAYKCRNNAAPGTLVPTVTSHGRKRTLEWMRWGLIPPWAADTKIGYRSFIARANQVASAPRFCAAWMRRQRCLIIADAIYEHSGSGQHHFAFARSDNRALLIAGLWEVWRPRGHDTLRSCTILAANTDGLAACSREVEMPAIIDPADCSAWFGEEDADVTQLLTSFPFRVMTIRPLRSIANEAARG